VEHVLWPIFRYSPSGAWRDLSPIVNVFMQCAVSLCQYSNSGPVHIWETASVSVAS
jgi:hypothetical protein